MSEIRGYRAGDEAGICRLFETCHGRALPLDVWAWRYRARAEGAPITEVAVEGGEVVGHLSALPARLARGGRALSAALWVDLMVHPSRRNLALFLDLAEANRRRCAAEGVELLFAFPNDNSFHVMKRMLDWRHVGDILALEAAVASAPPAGALPRGWIVEELHALGPECEELWRRVKLDQALCGTRTAAWLAWRYREKPRARYPAWAVRHPGGALAGWLIAKTFDGPSGRVGDILDLWSEPGPAAEALIAAALGFFRHEGVAKASVWAPAHARAALARYGFEEGPDRTHLAARWTADRRPDLPARPEDWLMAKGDSDIF